MPDKHITFSESLLGIGSYILRGLRGSPKSLDALWSSYHSEEAARNSVNVSFDAFLLAIGFLYSIGTVKEEEGVLDLCG